MLFQLVCVDRRYQRMNCFNIRELQGILKRRFFPNLINLNEHHQILNSSMINLRYKNHNFNLIEPDQIMFYNFGILSNIKNKNFFFLKKTNTNLSYFNYSFINYFDNITFINKLKY
jgi:hypothetical protein